VGTGPLYHFTEKEVHYRCDRIFDLIIAILLSSYGHNVSASITFDERRLLVLESVIAREEMPAIAYAAWISIYV
jgi:hypothetical protein